MARAAAVAVWRAHRAAHRRRFGDYFAAIVSDPSSQSEANAGMAGQGTRCAEMAAPKLTRKELEDAAARRISRKCSMPRAAMHSKKLWHGGCRVRRHFHPRSLRPGGTDVGPDHDGAGRFRHVRRGASAIGWVPLAVTTNFTINFLQKTRAAGCLGRGAAVQARQAAGRRRNRHPLRWRR